MLRPSSTLRKMRSVHVTIATISLVVPASAAALTSATAGTVQPAETTAAGQGSQLAMRVAPRRINYDQKVTVTGRAPSADAGRTAVLETAISPHQTWRRIASTPIGGDGRFRMQAALRESGFVRVVEVNQPTAIAAATAFSAGAAGTSVSASRPVTVAAQLRLRPRSLEVLGGQSIRVGGRLLPAVTGRAVRLQGRSASGWSTLASARTGSAGGFRVRYAAVSGLQRQLRVVFAGDRANARSARPAGRLTVYGESVASWYDDAGSTACGFHAGLGVANLSLPCGSKVRIRYGGRSLTAVVDDRGPYVGGREWDLNQNVATALHFAGVGTVWTTG